MRSQSVSDNHNHRSYGLATACAVFCAGILGASAAQAGDDFERAFRHELGRIAAHSVVSAGAHLLGAHPGYIQTVGYRGHSRYGHDYKRHHYRGHDGRYYRHSRPYRAYGHHYKRHHYRRHDGYDDHRRHDYRGRHDRRGHRGSGHSGHRHNSSCRH